MRLLHLSADGRPGKAAIVLAGVLAMAMFSPLATQPAATPLPTTQPNQLSPAAAAEQQLQMVQADWLTDIARELWSLPPAGQAGVALWRMERQIALLETAVQIDQNHAGANFELKSLCADTAAAYQRLAQEALDSANRLNADGKAEPADRLRQMSTRYSRRAEELIATMREALSRYVQQVPHDLPAWEGLLRLRLETLQTADERIDYLSKRLAELEPATTAPDRQPGASERTATVLALLADYVARQGDQPKAAEFYRRAVQVMPLHLDAKGRLLEMAEAGGKASPADYLDFYLAGFRLRPTDMNTTTTIAGLLARYGVYELPAPAAPAGQAQPTGRGAIGWLDYTTQLYKDYNPGQPLPSWLLLQQAEALYLADKFDQAGTTARQVISQNEKGSPLTGANDAGAPLPTIDLEARILLANILQAQDPKLAGPEFKTIVDYYDAHRSKPSFGQNATLNAWMSWFYLRKMDEPKTAVELGRQAVKADPNNGLAQRSLGAALSADAATAKDAVELLTPLATSGDSWSFYYLAQARRSLKEDAKAEQLLKGLCTDRPGTWAGKTALDDLKRKNIAPPPAPQTDSLRAMLDKLPAELFDFHSTPGRFASVELNMFAGAGSFESMALHVRLANKTAMNRQSGFDVTVGDSLMVWPAVLVSAMVQLPGEEKPRVFRNYCRLHIASPHVLAPGELTVSAGTIDVGPIRQLLRMTPQAEKTITFSLLINPVEVAPGQWDSGTGGYYIERQFVRAGMSATRNAIDEAVNASRNGWVGSKLLANRALGSLLVEQQLAKQLSYRVRNVPMFSIEQPLEQAAADPDPRVRAFLADAVYPAGLAGKLLDAVDNGLRDRNWLVRLMTVRLLGDRLAGTYARQITQIAGNDENGLVRRLAQTYVDQWAAERK